jgi:hypothetical protein
MLLPEVVKMPKDQSGPVAGYAAEGGKARAVALTREQRREIAHIAAVARWSKEGHIMPVQATYGAPDRPLRIGTIEIPCYVLADGRRVLAQRGLQAGIGMSRSGGKPGARRLAQFLASLGAKGLQVNDLIARINNPIRFIPPHGGNMADGYEATILPDICDVVLDARRIGDILLAQQEHIADACEILVRAFAKVGIIALVDEATGFQDDRAKNALAKILEAFIAKELRKWVSTFPVDYYKELFRLRGWKFPQLPADQRKRPVLVGKITNDVVYDRLAPGVRLELNRLTPRDEKGRLKHKLFQRLTEDVGHPKLREHLASSVALMKASDSWEQFKHLLDRALPRYGDTPYLPFEG